MAGNAQLNREREEQHEAHHFVVHGEYIEFDLLSLVEHISREGKMLIANICSYCYVKYNNGISWEIVESASSRIIKISNLIFDKYRTANSQKLLCYKFK